MINAIFMMLGIIVGSAGMSFGFSRYESVWAGFGCGIAAWAVFILPLNIALIMSGSI